MVEKLSNSSGRNSSDVLESYSVKHLTVDILVENSTYIDSSTKNLGHPQLPKVTKDLDIHFYSYSLDMVNRCKCRRIEGYRLVFVYLLIRIAISTKISSSQTRIWHVNM